MNLDYKTHSASLFDTIYENEKTIQLNHPPITIEAMLAEEVEHSFKNLSIDYSFIKSYFGDILMASTYKGICYMAFTDNHEGAIKDLYDYFPKASFQLKNTTVLSQLNDVFLPDYNLLNPIKLHVKGTEFQLKVWKALLQIPLGKLTTYRSIATTLNQSSASRAVGTAIGSNPVAFLIPCHRVVQSNGKYGNYMWGIDIKDALINWEATQSNTINSKLSIVLNTTE